MWLIRALYLGFFSALVCLGFWAAKPNYGCGGGRGLQTLGVCKELQLGIASFHAEYGKLPIRVSRDVTLDMNSAEGLALLNVLLGMVDGPNPVNVRGIKFIDIKEAKAQRDGVVYAATDDRVVGFYDSWGGSYKVRLDGDGDEVVEVKPKAWNKAIKVEGSRVLIWSDGPDGVAERGGASDDVTSW